MNPTVQPGKAIGRGYKWTLRITMTEVSFPVGVEITGHVRKTIDDPDILTTLSTSNGSIVRVDDKNIDLTILGVVSAGWNFRSVTMDFVRTDTTPDTYLEFRLDVPVTGTVTRGLP